VPFVVVANVISQSLIGSTHQSLFRNLFLHLTVQSLIPLPFLTVILLFRTYALYNRSYAILGLVSMAWAAATAIGVVSTP
jgi:hypothetical protein